MKRTVTILRVLYPVWALVGMFSLMYVPGELVVSGDAVQTASNIQTNELLFRLGIFGRLLTQLIGIVAVYYVYQLFQPVNKELANWTLILALVGIPIAMLAEQHNLAVLSVLDDPQQIKTYLGLARKGVFTATIFWGLWLLPQGLLIYRSGWFPKWVGVAMFLAGMGYTLSFCVELLFPKATTLLSVFEILTFGELVWMLWLMIRGAKIPE